MEDKIEEIPKTMEKFFGCSGEMVKPSSETVRAVVRKIRKGSLITLNQLRDKIAKDFSVQTACPASITKALKVLSKESEPICYWRVIKKKGELIAQFPDGVKGHASLLENEGFKIDINKKTPVVVDYKTRLSELT